jgi:hypothetical protein
MAHAVLTRDDVADALFALGHDIRLATFQHVVRELERFHAARGTRDPERMAAVQARTLVLVEAYDLELAVVASRLGVSLSSVNRYVRDLRLAFPQLETAP